MTRSELITRLAETRGISTHKAEDVVEEMFDVMSEALINNDNIEIRGFGSFTIREYAARSGRNPKTGIEINVAAKKSPFFKCGKSLKEKLATTNK
jgi:integration host factor subunit beta